MSLKIANSARNQFHGKVTKLTEGMVNTEVILDIGDGVEITAIITNSSVKYLNLKVGVEAIAFFKASWVILNLDKSLKTSARNNFPGKILSAKEGAVNSEVVIQLASGQELVAIVTNESLKSLNLQTDLEVTALVKASHVIIGIKA
ncbi:MAG: TOBE domain-containing protein [Deltaproteobacteria bacterium]|jgi:molybdate transport system regulatory protein|nr:TOBE domain-containing protein [Deltaproteobacteria bacterium]